MHEHYDLMIFYMVIYELFHIYVCNFDLILVDYHVIGQDKAIQYELDQMLCGFDNCSVVNHMCNW